MKLAYPAARKVDQVDEYFGTAVADPYRWMEELDSAELKEWVDAENALTQEFLADVPARGRIHARLMDLTNYERFGMPEREAGRLFYMRNSGLQNQSVLYWQDGEEGEAKVLIDPNTLSEDGTVALGSYSVSEDGRLIAYALSEAGSDIQRIHVRRVDTGGGPGGCGGVGEVQWDWVGEGWEWVLLLELWDAEWGTWRRRMR